LAQLRENPAVELARSVEFNDAAKAPAV